MYKVVVIGGGASGLMASYAASKNGNRVILLEKNEKLGKKIYITGKGRCNLTSSVEKNEFFNNIVNNSKFMYGAFNAFSNVDTMNFFEDNGLKLKVERGNRVFPESDRASDVTKTLERVILKQGVDIQLNSECKEIITDNGIVKGVKTDKGIIQCDKAIVCTGGISYSSTGSTGDGYKFAVKNGHKVINLKPALVGIELKGSDFVSLQGVSLKNVTLTAKCGNKIIYTEFGEMLFTHYGISGPVVLSCSSVLNSKNPADCQLIIDLKPALANDVLTKRLIREFTENHSKNLSSVMRSLLPKALIEVVLRQAKLNGNKNCSEITVSDRESLIYTLKNFIFYPKRLRPVEEAIITSGGVCVKEINPKTMESKLVNGLYFAGEVIDVDAFTGGFNLQIAFSTGFAAGNNI